MEEEERERKVIDLIEKQAKLNSKVDDLMDSFQASIDSKRELRLNSMDKV